MPSKPDDDDATLQQPRPAVPSLSEHERIQWHLKHAAAYRERLLANIKSSLPELEALLAEVDDHSGMEDGVYRI